MDKKLVGIGEAAKALGVAPVTLRRWEKSGKLLPDSRTKGDRRRYDLNKLRGFSGISQTAPRRTIGYARVSSHDQKADLERQKEMIELYCAAKGWQFEIVSDLGSGMNYRKKGLNTLLEEILAGRVERLVLTHKDRLLRFGAELIFSVCSLRDVDVVVINQGEETTFEEDLAGDVLEIITVFSARLYGSRSRKNAKMMKDIKAAADAALEDTAV